MSLGQPTGVMIPRGQLATDDEGAPMTVVHAVPMTLVAVMWYDESGIGHSEVWFQCGEVIYQPPNAEAWANGLNTVKEVLKQQVLDKLAAYSAQQLSKSGGANVVQDSVDVLGGSEEPGESTSAT